MSVGASVVGILSSPIKMVALTAGLGGVVLSAGGVFTVLNAQASNATAQAVTNGTLSLTLSSTSPSGGITTSVTGLAPTNSVNRFVTLTNGGNLDGDTLTMSITTANATLGIANATRGLTIQVDSCSVAWTQASGGSCSGTTTSVLAATPLATLTSTPQALAGTLVGGATVNLRVRMALPAVDEWTCNGTIGYEDNTCATQFASGSRIQGASADLTYKFEMTQDVVNTNISS